MVYNRRVRGLRRTALAGASKRNSYVFSSISMGPESQSDRPHEGVDYLDCARDPGVPSMRPLSCIEPAQQQLPDADTPWVIGL